MKIFSFPQIIFLNSALNLRLFSYRSPQCIFYYLLSLFSTLFSSHLLASVSLLHLHIPSSLPQEFKFMGQCRSPSISPSRQSVSSSVPLPEELSLFQLFLQDGNPFEVRVDHKEEETEDVLASNGVSVEN